MKKQKHSYQLPVDPLPVHRLLVHRLHVAPVACSPLALLPPDGSSVFTVVVRKQKQRAGLTQDFTFDYRADRQIRRFGLHDSDCILSDAPMWSADRQIRRFGLQTVKFDELECRPSKSMIWSADRPMCRLTTPSASSSSTCLRQC